MSTSNIMVPKSWMILGILALCAAQDQPAYFGGDLDAIMAQIASETLVEAPVETVDPTVETGAVGPEVASVIVDPEIQTVETETVNPEHTTETVDAKVNLETVDPTVVLTTVEMEIPTLDVNNL